MHKSIKKTHITLLMKLSSDVVLIHIICDIVAAPFATLQIRTSQNVSDEKTIEAKVMKVVYLRSHLVPLIKSHSPGFEPGSPSLEVDSKPMCYRGPIN